MTIIFLKHMTNLTIDVFAMKRIAYVRSSYTMCYAHRNICIYQLLMGKLQCVYQDYVFQTGLLWSLLCWLLGNLFYVVRNSLPHICKETALWIFLLHKMANVHLTCSAVYHHGLVKKVIVQLNIIWLLRLLNFTSRVWELLLWYNSSVLVVNSYLTVDYSSFT